MDVAFSCLYLINTHYNSLRFAERCHHIGRPVQRKVQQTFVRLRYHIVAVRKALAADLAPQRSLQLGEILQEQHQRRQIGIAERLDGGRRVVQETTFDGAHANDSAQSRRRLRVHQSVVAGHSKAARLNEEENLGQFAINTAKEQMSSYLSLTNALRRAIGAQGVVKSKFSSLIFAQSAAK